MASRSDRYKQNTKKNVKSTKNNKKTKQVKKVKIKYKKLLMFLLIFSIIIFAAISFFKQNITNIYISGNEKLTEQEIIDIAKVSNYPNTFLNLSSTIKNRLEKNVYIKSAKVYKKSFTILYIEVEENRPLFYNSSSNETVLLDGKTVQEKLEAPVLINMIPDTLYEKFIKKISEIDYDVLKRVSEIKYDKNEVDETRFLFTMNDGNYVYLTLNTFEKINNYINIVKTFNNSILTRQDLYNISCHFFFIKYLDHSIITDQRLDSVFSKSTLCFTFKNSGFYYIHVVESGNPFYYLSLHILALCYH